MCIWERVTRNGGKVYFLKIYRFTVLLYQIKSLQKQVHLDYQLKVKWDNAAGRKRTGSKIIW